MNVLVECIYIKESLFIFKLKELHCQKKTCGSDHAQKSAAFNFTVLRHFKHSTFLVSRLCCNHIFEKNDNRNRSQIRMHRLPWRVKRLTSMRKKHSNHFVCTRCFILFLLRMLKKEVKAHPPKLVQQVSFMSFVCGLQQV